MAKNLDKSMHDVQHVLHDILESPIDTVSTRGTVTMGDLVGLQRYITVANQTSSLLRSLERCVGPVERF